MGMPVSGFPNQTAYVLDLWYKPHTNPDRPCRAAQEDEVGQLYLTNVDFLKNGVPASVIATMVRACA
jgi:phosphate transporter